MAIIAWMMVEFKLFSENDTNEVLEMMSSFNKIDDYDFDLRIGEQNLLKFSSNKDLGRLYLICNEGQNVGYIVLTFGFSFEYKGRDAFIDELFIKESFRNQGIGTLAMDFVESESRKLDINAVHLEVEQHNEQANQLYQSKGYSSNSRALMTKKIKPTTNVY